MADLRGTRWTDGMAVHGADMERESQAWESSLLERFAEISDFGVVNPDTDMLLMVRGGADPLELYISPGTAFTKAGEKIYIPSPSSPGGTPGVSFWLQPPNDATAAASSVFLDPTTGLSMLLGNPTVANLVWVIYYLDTDTPTLLADDTQQDARYVESFRIFVSPSTASRSDVPAFFWDNLDHAVLLGVVSPTSVTTVAGATIDMGQSVYAYNRPTFSGRDAYARRKLNDFSLLLDTYPNAYIERRSSAIGNVYGDVYTETFFASNVYKDDLGGSYTGVPGTYYVRATHIPKAVVSATRSSDSSSMLDQVGMVDRTRLLTLTVNGTATTPIAQGDSVTITYGYYNICEPYLNKSTNPDSVSVLSPLENEMVLVEATPITTLASDTCTPTESAQYPAVYTFFMTKDAILDVKPRTVFHAIDMTRYTPGQALPVERNVTSPSKLLCYLTGGVPSKNGVTFQIYGLDAGGNSITDTVTVTQASSKEEKPGLGNNGSDWSGYFTLSTQVFAAVTGCYLVDNDASNASVGSNRHLTAFVLSAEDVDLLHDLPNCRVTINAAGDALDWTFQDLRSDNLFQSMLSFISTCQQVQIADGVIKAYLPAGEYIPRYNVVYLKPGDPARGQDPTVGYVYSAIATNDPYKPNVVGIAADTSIAESSSSSQGGWITLRGVVVNNNWSFSPGVLYLSGQNPGKISAAYPYASNLSSPYQQQVTFLSGATTPYMHIVLNGYNFYSPSQPGGAPTGTVFASSSDPTETAANFSDAVNATTDATIRGVVQADATGQKVTISSANTKIQTSYINLGDGTDEVPVLAATALNASILIGGSESGGAVSPTSGDYIAINGSQFVFGTDWTDASSFAALINQGFNNAITATVAGTNLVNLASSDTMTIEVVQTASPAYGNASILLSTETFKAPLSSVMVDQIRYIPVVRCAYAITGNRILFDGPIFSKRYASELYVEDYFQQYWSNQAEGCLVELPKFISACRNPIIIPLAGAAPIFSDVDSATGENKMFVWVQGFTANSAVVCIAIKRVTSQTGTGWYLTPDNPPHGSITIRVAPGSNGEISGMKNNGYIDKLGNLISDTGQSYMELYTQAGSANQLPQSALAFNPYSQYQPPDESYNMDDDTTSATVTGVTTWNFQGANGHDVFEFVDAQTVRLGFRSSTSGDACRLYVTGYDTSTILEIAIGPKKNSARVHFFALGWERIGSFGVEGDKLRFYLTPRCSEPWIYNANINNVDPGVAPAANNPRTCQVLSTRQLPRICAQWM